MTDLGGALVEQADYLIGPEGIAVAAAVLYLLFAIRQNIWCWLFAGLSTAIYVYVFFAARLYMESALNVFYFAMAFYGWYSWRNSSAANNDELPVVIWPARTHAVAVLAILMMSSATGFVLDRATEQAYPYVDSATTWSAIWATFLMARKVLENWWYWLVIDVTSIFIYWSRDLELTALLFVVYVAMIPFGLMAWRRSMPVTRP